MDRDEIIRYSFWFGVKTQTYFLMVDFYLEGSPNDRVVLKTINKPTDNKVYDVLFIGIKDWEILRTTGKILKARAEFITIKNQVGNG